MSQPILLRNVGLNQVVQDNPQKSTLKQTLLLLLERFVVVKALFYAVGL